MFTTLLRNTQRYAARNLERTENRVFVKSISSSTNEDENLNILTNIGTAAVKPNIAGNHVMPRKMFSTASKPTNDVSLQKNFRRNSSIVSKDTSRDFMSYFPDLVRDLTEAASKYDSKDLSKLVARSLQYNVPRGKTNRGLITIMAYKTLVKKDQLTPEHLRRINYLGWCVEILQSTFLIVDDIMDGSETRRGQPCWHKVEDVGLRAINDSLMFENLIYFILKKNFNQRDYYIKLVELFHDTVMITTFGQMLDMQTATKNVITFNMERYKSIVAHKTSFYTFYLPVALAMHASGHTDPEVFRQAKTILLEMGYFFQVQDDYLDCFGNSDVTGKIGTDIQDNKCTWLAVSCMQRASSEQKQIMKDNYGQTDIVKINNVKKLYEDLGLPHMYTLYEQESYNLIKLLIQQTSRGVPHDIFNKIIEMIYQRKS